MTHTVKLLLAALALLGLSACGGPQKFLIADSFNASRLDKAVLIPAGTAEKVQLYNYVMRLCDIDASGAESNCKDSLVLSNVVSGTLY